MNMPELPTPYIRHWINAPFTDVGLHTDESMRAYGEACAAQERERCAKLCENVAAPYQAAGASVAVECAAAIRAGQPTGG